MRRVVVAVLVAGVVFGAVYGLAASLGVSTKSLGAGNSAVAACQSGTLTASYAVSYDSTIPGYKVGVATVSGLDTTSANNCASKSFRITLTNAANASLAEVTGTTPASGSSFTADFSSSGVPASNVTGIHLVIAG
jgi:hypothetical protein